MWFNIFQKLENLSFKHLDTILHSYFYRQLVKKLYTGIIWTSPKSAQSMKCRSIQIYNSSTECGKFLSIFMNKNYTLVQSNLKLK